GVRAVPVNLSVEHDEQAAWLPLRIIARGRVDADGSLLVENLARNLVADEFPFGHFRPTDDPRLRRGGRKVRAGPVCKPTGVERIGLERSAVHGKQIPEPRVARDAVGLEPDVGVSQAAEFPLAHIVGWDVPQANAHGSGLSVAAPDESDPAALVIAFDALDQRSLAVH